MKIILLKDYQKEALEFALEVNNNRPIDSEYYYPKKNIEIAVEELAKHNLSYNSDKGKTYLGKELLSEYSNKRDIPTYDNDLEVVRWQFVNFIMNSAGRLTRGCSAI